MKDLSVLIVTNSIVESDPRVLRQIQWLKPFSQIQLLEYGSFQEEGVKTSRLEKKGFSSFSKVLFLLFSLLRLFNNCLGHDPKFKASSSAFANLDTKFDLVVINDLANLPAACLHFSKSKVIFDSHEFYPDQFNNFKFRLIFKSYYEWIAKIFIPKTQMFLTVSEGISTEYVKVCGNSAEVIYNAPEFQGHSLVNSSTPTKPIKMIHHGAAIRLRKIELMIEMAKRLGPDFTLDLMLTENEPIYYQELKNACAQLSNVHMKPFVPTKSIVANLAQYDLGIFILPPVTKNYLYTLPNKFFEFTQGGLGIVIGPSPEMAKLGSTIGNTVVATSFEVEEVVQTIKNLSVNDILRMKQASVEGAAKYCAQTEGEKFVSLVKRLFEP